MSKLRQARACALAVQIHTSIILAAATSSRCLKTTFRTSLRRFTDFLFGCSSIAWKFTGRPYLETHQHTQSSAGKGHTFPLLPFSLSLLSPGMLADGTLQKNVSGGVCLLIWKHFGFKAESQRNGVFVFHLPVSAPKELIINFVRHLFCGHPYCLLLAPGMRCVRDVPSHKETVPGRQLWILTSIGTSASTACLPTYLRTDSTKTLKAFTWIQATNASLKFTFSQRSNGPYENRYNSIAIPLLCEAAP